MPDPDPQPPYGTIYLYTVIFYALLAAFLLLAITQAYTAYSSTQKSLVLKADADNASVRYAGEANLKEQEAAIALEVARNAAQRTKGEADTVDAEADKIAAEALTLKQQAFFAQQKAREYAATTQAEFELKKAEAFARAAELRNAAPTLQGKVEQAEADVQFTVQALQQGMSYVCR
jgi:hypothetical protein